MEITLGLAKGIFTKDIIEGETFTFYLSYILEDPYKNFIVPKTNDSRAINLKEAEDHFNKVGLKPVVYLLEEQIELGFPEYLNSQGYSLLDNDTWMTLDVAEHPLEDLGVEIRDGNTENLDDYLRVSKATSGDWPGNEKFLEICQKTFKRELKNGVTDLQSEYYLIYQDGKPAAAATMFYSQSQNFAYFHTDGTLEEYRGKGYQTALILYRVNKIKRLGITRAYALVEEGNTSFKNYHKCGFKQVQRAQLFKKKPSP